MGKEGLNVAKELKRLGSDLVQFDREGIFEAGEPFVMKKITTTPKAIIYQKFGSNACYTVDSVDEELTQNGCPGLAILQKGPCLFRCTLQLPEFSVVSETFKKKRDAEQAAAKMALDKLGIHPVTDNPVIQDPWDELTNRITYFYSNEFLSSLSLHPLSGHIRAALQRGGDLNGLLPVSLLPACDSKLSNLCKSINPEVERNPCLATEIIARAVSRLSGTISISGNQLSMWRQNPYSLEFVQSLDIQQSSVPGSICVESLRVPCLLDEAVGQLTLQFSSNGYYLDAIAQKLGVPDASNVFISRTIGKASSETRLYYAAPKSLPLSDVTVVDGNRSFNARASYLCGQNIYGDAIMTSAGYTWKSRDLFYEDIPLRSYFRMLLNKMPNGSYKLSREAIFAAELPTSYTTRTNWRGSFPRDLLLMFCRQHSMSEPVFSEEKIPLKASSMSSKIINESGVEADNGKGQVIATTDGESTGTFKCNIKLYKSRELLLECSPRHSYKKLNDAIQNSSLSVLLWLNAYFYKLDLPLEKLISTADALDIKFHPQKFIKEFELCLRIHQRSEIQRLCALDTKHTIQTVNGQEEGHGFHFLDIQGSDSRVTPMTGSLVCLSYVVSLVKEGEHMKELLENCPEFEFEIGTGAVIPHIEAAVTQMCVDQTASFNMDLPNQRDFVLAAACATAETLASLRSEVCFLEYSLTLLRVTEPLEDRMEQAFFSPPLSKQRVEFALLHIKESCATNLIDFGCGSGSLLDSLLDYPTSLENIVGVDISQKSLSRAAKILHTKLNRDPNTAMPSTCLKSALLYEGSIIDFDSRVCGFQIGTCLEVIEHMEEDQACLFGDMVLGHFCPKILVVSTPNYEYNVIIQKSNKEDKPDDKSESQACKFRNHDHKFEWTRAQFNHWAADLATRHDYDVEFSGVGGTVGVEPGFASQIAVFRRRFQPSEAHYSPENVESSVQYQVIWEWSSKK